MAAPQLGDVIKFAELAWTLIDYGWSDDHNASEHPLKSSLRGDIRPC